MEPNTKPSTEPNMQPYEHLHIVGDCDPALLTREEEDQSKEEDQSTEEQKEAKEIDGAEVDCITDSYGDDNEEEDWEYLYGPFPRDVEVRFGRSQIRARASLVDVDHPYVLRLDIYRSALFKVFAAVACRLLPTFVQNLVKARRPGIFLPQRVILKQRKPRWTQEFEHEKRNYGLVSALQGKIIPVCYGEAACEGRRALILSDLGGVAPWMQEEMMEPAEFKRQVLDLFISLLEYNAVNEDWLLNNYLVVGGKVWMLDLERMFIYKPESAKRYADDTLEQLMYFYQRALDDDEGRQVERSRWKGSGN